MNGTLTPRMQFRDVLTQVTAQAKAILPEAVNGRLESAAKMVLAGDVFFKADGTVEVGSRSNPAVTYTLQGTTCTCVDFGTKAPQGWCAHRVAANLARSVERVLARRGEPAPEPLPVLDPEPVEPWGDNDIEGDDPEESPPTPPPLPEAPASCNAYVMIGGHRVQVTLRDSDEHRMLERLATLLQQYPPAPDGRSQPQPQAPAPEEKRFCPRHGTEMQSNHEDGRSWWSHRLGDGTWCKGK